MRKIGAKVYPIYEVSFEIAGEDMVDQIKEMLNDMFSPSFRFIRFDIADEWELEPGDFNGQVDKTEES